MSAAAQVALGDVPSEEQFSSTVEQYRVLLERIAGCYLPESQVQDAVQDALLLAWAKRDQYRGEARFHSWIAAILRMVCLSRLRKPSREIQMPPGCNPLEPETVTTRLWRREQLAFVHSCVATLSPALRAYMQRALAGEPIEGKPSTIKALRHRALLHLMHSHKVCEARRKLRCLIASS